MVSPQVCCLPMDNFTPGLIYFLRAEAKTSLAISLLQQIIKVKKIKLVNLFGR